MKKVIFICLFAVSFLMASQEVDLKHNITAGIGFGTDGFVYRNYNKDGYVEYIGAFTYQNGDYSHTSFNAGINIGQYLLISHNEKVDFAIKYVYGLQARKHTYDYVDEISSKSNILAHISLGLELISPKEQGISVELLVGQKIQYNNDSSILVNSTGAMYVMFNY